MSDSTDSKPAAAPRGGVLDNIKLGLKVMADELKWTVTRVVRNYEIKQMKRRLDEEYALLGKLARKRMDAGEAKAAMPRDGEAGIILSQIEFLEKEMEFLEQQMESSRGESLARRREELGLNDKD